MNRVPVSESDARERKLEDLLADAEGAVRLLRLELEQVRARRAREDELEAQHQEIDRLREHLAAAQVQWSAVRDFFEDAVRELDAEHRSKDGDA